MPGNNSTTTLLLGQQSDFGIKTLSELLPISIAITLINGVVFILFYRRLSLRTASNYLLLGLAICDFLTGAINIPYFIVFTFKVVPPHMTPDFNYWLYILHNFNSVSAAYHILVITAERYFAIMKPLRHHVFTKGMVLKLLSGVWLVSAFIALIPLTFQASPSIYLWLSIHTAVCLLTVFLFPYLFILFAYTVMFKVISSRRKSRIMATGRGIRGRNQINNDRKCLFIFATMATIFAFCWMPYFTTTFVINVRSYLKCLPPVNRKVVQAVVIIRYMTSITNPLLYTFFKRDFWIALKNLPLKRGLSLRKRKRSSHSSIISSKVQRRPCPTDHDTMWPSNTFSGYIRNEKIITLLSGSWTIYESSV